MKLSNATLLSLAATAIAAPVATVTVHEHVRHTVIVEGYVYIDGTTTSTGYRTINEQSAETAAPATETDTAAFVTQVVAAGATASPSSQAVAAEYVSDEDTTTNVAPSTTSTAQQTTLTPTPTTTTKQTATSTPATSTAATSTSSSDSSLSSFASSMLNEHNTKRALHKDTPALSWSDELASYAQNYADGYDCSGSLTHSGGPYGENLAIGYGTTGAVDAWYNEIKDYSYSNADYSSSTGHFTQVVWKSTTKVGCGIKQCGGVWGDYIICSYDPAGNMLGDFASNVEPLA